MHAWEVAKLAQGQLHGDPNTPVTGVAPLSAATRTDVTFLVHARNAGALLTTQAGCLLVDEATWQACEHKPEHLAVVVCAQPVWGMAKVSALLHPAPPTAQGQSPQAMIDAGASVHPSAHVAGGAYVGPGAQVGPDAQLGPLSFVGQNVHIGARSVLHPGAKVLWGCTVGEDVILHAGCVVGGDGFGLAQSPTGPEHIKVQQLGIVRIGNRVEVGANTTIDRATFGATVVGDGCKIDNLVQIGHNVTLGQHCVIVSQTGIAGSAALGDSVTVGAQGGIVGHLHIASGTTLAARTGVISSLKTPGVYAGAPAMEHRAWLRMIAALRDLGPMRKRLAALARTQPSPSKAP